LQGCGMQVVLEGDCSFVVHHHSWLRLLMTAERHNN
jgi:hypothetical protein